MDGRWQRARSAADLDPAAARFRPDPRVPDEAMPAVLAAVLSRAVAGAERDPALDSETVLRPVVRRREANLSDPSPVEPDEHSASVQAIAVPGLGAVLGLHLRLVTAERDVADPAPRNEDRRVRSLADHPARERRRARAE